MIHGEKGWIPLLSEKCEHSMSGPAKNKDTQTIRGRALRQMLGHQWRRGVAVGQSHGRLARGVHDPEALFWRQLSVQRTAWSQSWCQSPERDIRFAVHTCEPCHGIVIRTRPGQRDGPCRCSSNPRLPRSLNPLETASTTALENPPLCFPSCGASAGSCSPKSGHVCLDARWLVDDTLSSRGFGHQQRLCWESQTPRRGLFLRSVGASGAGTSRRRAIGCQADGAELHWDWPHGAARIKCEKWTRYMPVKVRCGEEKEEEEKRRRRAIMHNGQDTYLGTYIRTSYARGRHVVCTYMLPSTKYPLGTRDEVSSRFSTGLRTTISSVLLFFDCICLVIAIGLGSSCGWQRALQWK